MEAVDNPVALLSPSKEQGSLPEGDSLSAYTNLQINMLFEQKLEHPFEQLYREDCVCCVVLCCVVWYFLSAKEI